MLERAFRTFKATSDRLDPYYRRQSHRLRAPTKEGTAAAHGEPLGEDEIRATKRFYGWPEDAKFRVPEAAPAQFRAGLGARGRTLHDQWMERFERYRADYPDSPRGTLPHAAPPAARSWDKDLPKFESSDKGVAGREASSKGY